MPDYSVRSNLEEQLKDANQKIADNEAEKSQIIGVMTRQDEVLQTNEILISKLSEDLAVTISQDATKLEVIKRLQQRTPQSLEDKNQSLEDEVQSLKLKLAEKDEKLAARDEKIRLLEAENKGLREEKKGLIKRIAELEKDTKQLKTKIENVTRIFQQQGEKLENEIKICHKDADEIKIRHHQQQKAQVMEELKKMIKNTYWRNVEERFGEPATLEVYLSKDLSYNETAKLLVNDLPPHYLKNTLCSVQ